MSVSMAPRDPRDPVWTEYDNAAYDLAKRGLKGKEGDPLPVNLSAACLDEINYDPEAFQTRVRDMAYGLSYLAEEGK